ncbi:MAG: WD40 repeat domain-containing protein [Kofleriaceae bacterium]
MLAFSPSGRRLVTAEFESSRHVGVVRDAKTRAVLARLSGHDAAINDLAMTPDERIALTGSSDGTVRVWDVASERELRSLDANLASSAKNAAIWSIAVSPDGTRVAAAGNDRLIRVWTIATGDALLAAREHHGAIDQVAFSPDGRVLASSDQAGLVLVRDTSTGRILFRLPPADRALSSLTFSPDGRRLLTQTGSGKARYWDASTGTSRGDLPGVVSGALTFTPDGNGVFARNTTRIVRLHDAMSGAEIRAFGFAQPHDNERANLSTPSSVSVSPDGMHLAVVRWDQQIHVWDIATGALVRTVPGLLHVKYSPDGKLFATALGQIDKRSTKLQLAIVDAMTGAILHTLSTGVEAAFTPDGKTLAALHQGTLEIWSTTTGQRLRRTDAHGALTFVLSPDGKRAATGANDGTVVIWDLE